MVNFQKSSSNDLCTLHVDITGERTADATYDLIDKIGRNLSERNCDVQLWATYDLIVDILKNPNTKNQDAVNKLLKNICDLYEVYFDIFLATKEGEIVGVANRQQLIGNNVAKQAWFSSVLLGNTNTVSDMQFDKNVGAYTVAYSAPVIDKNGALIGVISTRFNWNFIYDIIKKSYSQT